jgi:hypothetical protein
MSTYSIRQADLIRIFGSRRGPFGHDDPTVDNDSWANVDQAAPAFERCLLNGCNGPVLAYVLLSTSPGLVLFSLSLRVIKLTCDTVTASFG